MEVNGRPTPSLDAFLAAIAGIGDNTDVRLKCTDLGGRVRVFTLRTDMLYWPTSELRLEPPDGVAPQSVNSALAPLRGSKWTLVRHVPTTTIGTS